MSVERPQPPSHPGERPQPSSHRAERVPPPSHRAQRLIIAATVVVVAAVVVLLTRFVTPRSPSRAAQVRLIEPPAQNAPVELYFASEDGTGLAHETREIALPEGPAERLRVLVKELSAGPTSGGARILPAGTSLRAVYVLEDGETMCLDFSNDLRVGLGGGSTREYLALGSLMETIRANMPKVKHVQLLLEGRVVESLSGHYDISRPLDVEEWKAETP